MVAIKVQFSFIMDNEIFRNDKQMKVDIDDIERRYFNALEAQKEKWIYLKIGFIFYPDEIDTKTVIGMIEKWVYEINMKTVVSMAEKFVDWI